MKIYNYIFKHFQISSERLFDRAFLFFLIVKNYYKYFAVLNRPCFSHTHTKYEFICVCLCVYQVDRCITE